MITQAVILAGGLGTRMQKAMSKASFNEKEKHLLSKGLKGMVRGHDNRPIFDSCVQNLIDAGIKKLIFIVNKQGREFIKDYYDSRLKDIVEVEYVIQKEALGTANAVLTAEGHTGNDRFITIWYDNVYSEEAIKQIINAEVGWGAIGFDRDGLENPEISNIRKEVVRKWAGMKTDNDYYLIKILENPGKEQDKYVSPDGKVLISVGLFAFDKDIFEACKNIKPVEKRGKMEYDINDAVRYGVEKLGKKMKILYHYGGIIDLTSAIDVDGARKIAKDRKIEF